MAQWGTLPPRHHHGLRKGEGLMGTWVSRRAKGWMLVMDRSVCKAKSAKWELERLHTPLIIETALLVRLANEKQLLASIDQSVQWGGCRANKRIKC